MGDDIDNHEKMKKKEENKKLKKTKSWQNKNKRWSC